MQKKLLSIIISLLLLLTLVPLIGRAVLAVESGETGAITETAVVLNINVSPSLIDFGMVAPGGSSPADPMDRTITVDSTGANCDQLITTEILGEVQTVAGEKLNYGNGTITEFGPTDYTPISEATVYLDGIEQMSGVTVYESTGMVTFAAAPASGVLVTINYTSSSTFYSEYLKFNDPALPQPPGPEVKASAYARELLFGETATIVMDIYPPQDYPIGVNPYEIGRVVFYAEASGAPHCILTITTTGNGDTDPAEGFHAYEEGEVVPITATADPGWEFDSWTGDVATVADVNNVNTTVTMNGDYTITANFTEIIVPTYNLTYTAGPNGSLTGDTAQTVNGGEDGTPVTAVPDAGYQFVDWSDGITDNPRTDTNVTSDISVTANFVQITHDLTMAVNGSGSTTPAAGVHTYNEGDVVNINATPAAGWEFVNWSGGVADSNSASTTVLVDADKSVTANFTQIPHDLTMVVSGSGSTTPAAGMYTYNEGDVVDITATPAAGWEFDSWSGDVADPNSASTTVLMNADKTVTANFIQITHNLTYAAGLNGTLTGDTAQTVNEGEDGTPVTAVPDAGYQFVDWSDGITDNPRTDTNVTSDISVTANFVQITHDLTMAVNGSGSTTPAAGVHTYNEGDVVDINATPAAGWEFVNWSGGVADSNSASTTVLVDADKSVTANFTQIPHDLTMAVSGSGSTTPAAGVHTYYEGDVVDITAIAGPGWEFDSWTGDVANPNSASTTVLVDANKTVTAIFAHTNYILTIDIVGNGSVTFDPLPPYYIGDDTQVTLPAIADPGWTFSHWEGDLQGTATTRKIKMTGDMTVIAVFMPAV